MIKVKGLTKDYSTLRAVDNISFEVPSGQILGFLGPNGAGKTTTLKMITCYLTPSGGNVEVGEHNIHEHSLLIRKKIGYLPELNPLYLEMTVYDYLEFIARIRELTEEQTKSAIKRAISKCGISSVIAKPIHTLSKGFKQRVGLAQAILHDPEILILDEPTNGLDPNQILEIRELIKELGQEKTLIMSSHILQEVQAVCGRIIIINQGKIVADGSTDELMKTFAGLNSLSLHYFGDDKIIRSFAEQREEIRIKNAKTAENGENYLELEYPKEMDLRPELYNYLKYTDITLLEMHLNRFNLEDVFHKLTKGGKN